MTAIPIPNIWIPRSRVRVSRKIFNYMKRLIELGLSLGEVFLDNQGKMIIDDSGKLIVCDDCPCVCVGGGNPPDAISVLISGTDGDTFTNCCLGTSVSYNSKLVSQLTGVDGQYTLPYISGNLSGSNSAVYQLTVGGSYLSMERYSHPGHGLGNCNTLIDQIDYTYLTITISLVCRIPLTSDGLRFKVDLSALRLADDEPPTVVGLSVFNNQTNLVAPIGGTVNNIPADGCTQGGFPEITESGSITVTIP